MLELSNTRFNDNTEERMRRRQVEMEIIVHGKAEYVYESSIVH